MLRNVFMFLRDFLQISLGRRGKFVCILAKGEAALYPLLDLNNPTMRSRNSEFG